MNMHEFTEAVYQAMLPWADVLWQCLVAVLLSLIAWWIGENLLARVAKPYPAFRLLVKYSRRPVQAALMMLMIQIVLRSAPDSLPRIAFLRHFTELLLLASFTWLGMRCVAAVEDAISELNPADVDDNLNARRIRTQTKVLARTAMGLIALIGVSAALMTFPDVRQFGASLLASAGLAGLVVGFAAKPVLGNILAGLQIALSQPMRLDDVVIVEGEWGKIEEITGSYVVVRIWDERRLIVPLQWFIEHPFQNWTRNTAQILGSVFLWVDYAMPLEPLRAEARRICEGSPEWDQRLCKIQVTDSNERAMQLRVVISAADASSAWDLRCKLREELIKFIGENYAGYLPRLRAEFPSAETGPAPDS